MKKYILISIVSAITILFWSFRSDKTVSYCGREYTEKQANEYLKDENIKTIMRNVIDNKSNKPVFGYYVSALRNDTNFIYTKFSYLGDTVIRKSYFDYKISRGRDSIISKFVCKKNGLLFYSNQTYWNGEITKNEFPNRML